MKKQGMRSGHEYTVQVFQDKEMVGAFIITIEGLNMAETNTYLDSSAPLVAISEALACSKSAVDFQLQRPHLKRMLKKRIEELKRDSEEAEGKPPYPNDVDDIPF